MSSSQPGLTAKKSSRKIGLLPKIDPKALGTAIAKGVAHLCLGKYEDVADDAIDIAASLGLKDSSPEALAYELLQKSLSSAVFDLISESQIQISEDSRLEAFQSAINEQITDFAVTKDFLKNPLASGIGNILIDPLTVWLERIGYSRSAAITIANRLPGFCPFALHKEWSSNHSKYEKLLQSLQSPFADAAENQAAWILYQAKLRSKLEESIFGEPFGLRQIYIPLHASFEPAPAKKI